MGSMNEWKEYRFDEFVNVNPKVVFSKKENIAFVEMKDIDAANKFCTNSTYRNLSGGSRFENGDTLFARITPCLENGKIAQVRNLSDGKGLGSTEFHVLRGRPNISDSDFVYYLSRWNEVRDFAEINLHGTSGRQRFPADAFKELVLNLPGITEQQSIAEVLSSLDDKIDLHHRQNKTLEQMAETLFRQWFVEEAEETWEEVRLDEIATIQNGYAFKSGEYIEIRNDTLEVFKMGHISPGGGLKSSPKKDFVPRNSSLNRWILKKRDIVLAMTDMKDNVVILGVPALIDKDDHYVLNQRVARVVLKPDAKVIDQLLLYYYMSGPEFISTLQSKASSGVQVNLSTESIRESSIKIAPIKKQERAFPILNDIAEKQEKARLQIGLLENMRDTLLPKLMNGSVRVTNI